MFKHQDILNAFHFLFAVSSKGKKVEEKDKCTKTVYVSLNYATIILNGTQAAINNALVLFLYMVIDKNRQSAAFKIFGNSNPTKSSH